MMQRKKTAALFTALLLAFMTVFGGVPAKAAASEPDPRVASFTTTPETVQKGNPFEASFHFTHDYDERVQSVIIRVSSPNGAVRVGKSEYLVTDFDQGEDDDSDTLDYDLYIPERYLTYLGPGSGTLRFSITYCDDIEGKDKIKNGTFTAQKTVAFAADSSADSAVTVDENSATPTIRVGTSGTVGIPLISSAAVDSARIQVELPADSKIALSSAGSSYTMSFAAKEKKNLDLPLTVEATAAAGVYPITLTIDGAKVTAYLRVTESDTGKGGLIVQSYQLDRATIYSGSKFRMELLVKNSSATTHHNVTAALDGLATEGLTVSGSLDRKNIASIPAGGTASVAFELEASSKMESGNYILSISLSSDEAEAAVTKAFVPISGTGSTEGSKPVIIIESYDFGGMSITGGKEFLLKMNFKNTSTSTAIQNVKITISSATDEETGGVFTPANSSNTFFIPKIGAGASIQKELGLYPKADADPKSYGIDVKFDYESAADSKHEALTATETISIPLTQPDRFEITSANLFGPIYMGSEGQLSVNYVNKGKSKIFNLSVELAGNFTAGEKTSYIGNVDSGVSDSFDASLTPTEEGTLQGTAKFSYEDANGETKEVVKDFSCEVMAQPAMDPGMPESGMPGEETPPQQGGFPVWGTALLILGGIAVLVAGGLFLRKRIRAKRQRLLDEADDYDDIPVEVVPMEETKEVHK